MRDYQSREVLAYLSSRMSDRQIAEAFEVSAPTIRYWRDKHGLPRSNFMSPGNLKYDTDQSFFASIDNPKKAYILGFIIADGSIHKNGKSVSIAIKESDGALLRMIAKELNCCAPLGRKICVGFGGIARATTVLHLCGRRLVADLNALGVFHDKSKSATYPSVPNSLERHLVRGMFDGDGYIGPRQFSLVGTDSLVEGVVEAVERHTGCRLSYSRKKTGHLYAVGSRKDRGAARWMYSEAPIALERKLIAFRAHWA